jgi:acetolactate synthase I/II/III large subunit
MRLSGPDGAVAAVADAVSIAVTDRTRVLLSLPLEVQALDSEPPNGLIEPVAPQYPPAPAEEVEALARLLASAKRPLLLAGRGAVLSGARNQLEHLAEQTGALLATSAVGYVSSPVTRGTWESAAAFLRRGRPR